MLNVACRIDIDALIKSTTAFRVHACDVEPLNGMPGVDINNRHPQAHLISRIISHLLITYLTARMSIHSLRLSLSILLLAAVLSLAQTGPQAALIPACVVRHERPEPILRHQVGADHE